MGHTSNINYYALLYFLLLIGVCMLLRRPPVVQWLPSKPSWRLGCGSSVKSHTNWNFLSHNTWLGRMELVVLSYSLLINRTRHKKSRRGKGKYLYEWTLTCGDKMIWVSVCVFNKKVDEGNVWWLNEWTRNQLRQAPPPPQNEGGWKTPVCLSDLTDLPSASLSVVWPRLVHPFFLY